MSQTMPPVWRAHLVYLLLIGAVSVAFLAPPARCQTIVPANGSSTDEVLAQNSSPESSPDSSTDSSRDTPTNNRADKSSNNSAGKASDSQQSPEKKENGNKNDRMFFVMPNYLTVGNEAQVMPIGAKQKFSMAAKGAFDPYEFVIVGVLAGIRQAENAYPGFGQGMQGYGKRYGTAFADQVDGNIMVGAVFPTILKTDPRYFQMGKGRPIVRFAYAFTRIFITRTDSGHRLFNFPEFAGNATAIAISNVYYPAADRGFSASANNWGVQMGIDAFGNELKEFWPDIHRYLVKKRNHHADQQ